MTMQVESGIGATFIVLLAAFFVGILFIAIKNFNSDTTILGASQTQVVTMSNTERQEIGQWVTANNIVIPPGKGYNYVIQQYPDRPWLTGGQ